MENTQKTSRDLANDVYADLSEINAQQGTQGVDANQDLGDQSTSNEEVSTEQEQVIEPAIEPVSTTDDNVQDENSVVETELSDGEGDTTSTEEEDDGLFTDWFADDATNDATPPENSDELPNVNPFEDVAKELQIEGNSKEALIAAYQKLREDALKANEYSTLPSDITEAIKLSKEGKDYKAVFSSNDEINHSAYDDRTLLLNQNAKYFKDQGTGETDMESLSGYVDDMTETQQRIEAGKVRDQIDEYNMRKRQEVVESRQRKEESLRNELTSAVSGMDDYKGFKVTLKHKEEALQSIASGKAMKEMFYKEDGKTQDMNKVAQVYFLYKNFDTMKSYLMRRAQDQANRASFEQISNADPQGSRQSLTDPQGQKAPVSGADMLLDILKRDAGMIDNT